MPARVLRLLFVLYVVATAAHIALVLLHEPFAFDAWNIAKDTHAEPFSLSNLLDYELTQYLTSNPRLGQWFAYLAYKLEYFAVVATPLAYLALALAITILGLGRVPDWRRGRDLAWYAIVLGCMWFALPRIGMLLFCRAYSTNYIYTAAIQLWFLVPLRLGGPALDRGSIATSAAYFLFGVLAGACNEHTGPALALFALGYAARRHRATGRRPTTLWLGAFGVVVGFAIIFFAPGQWAGRYDGTAQQIGLHERLLQRGVVVNLDILRDYVLYAAPVLGLIVLALVTGRDVADDARPRLRGALALVGLAIAAGFVITATIFVSPKLGPRFYVHSCALLLAGFVAVGDAALGTARRLAPLVVLAAAASVYAGVRSIPLYLRLHDASDERMAALEAAPPGSVFTADSYDQVEDTWWFLGDDFRDIKKREMVRDYFALSGVIFRAVDVDAPLGVSDVRLVPRYRLEPEGAIDSPHRSAVLRAPPEVGLSIDDFGGLNLGTYRGIDLRALHEAARPAIDDLVRRIGGRARLPQLDLTVGFVGAAPKLPRKQLVVARWTPERYVGWSGTIRRGGVGKTRTIVLPKELAGGDDEIFIYHVGGEARRVGTARGGALDYLPWKRGAYWALACKPGADECFVFAATRLQ